MKKLRILLVCTVYALGVFMAPSVSAEQAQLSPLRQHCKDANLLFTVKNDGVSFFSLLADQLEQDGQGHTMLAITCRNVTQGLKVVSLSDCLRAVNMGQYKQENKKLNELACVVRDDLAAMLDSFKKDGQGRWRFSYDDARTLQLLNMCTGEIESLTVSCILGEVLEFKDSGGQPRIRFEFDSGGGIIRMYDSNGVECIRLDAATGGNIDVCGNYYQTLGGGGA